MYTPLSRVRRETFSIDWPDVRGWEVRTTTGNERLGKIDDLLLDETGAPRYLDVDLGLLQKHVLLPAAESRVDDADDVVWVSGMSKAQFKDLPAYEHDPALITRDFESRISAIYAAAAAAPEAPTRAVPTAADAQEPVGVERDLARLSQLDDYRVANGSSDPRGWDVVTSDALEIGAVADLLVHTQSMRTRYLICEVDEKAVGLESIDRHVLIPTRNALLDSGKKHVVVDGITGDRVRELPVYGGLPVTREIASALERIFRPRAQPGGAGTPEPAAPEPVAGEPVPVRDEETAQRSGREAQRRGRAARGRQEEVRHGVVVEHSTIGLRDTDEAPPSPERAEPAPDRSEPVTAARAASSRARDEEIRIRITGDQIIVERHPTEDSR